MNNFQFLLGFIEKHPVLTVVLIIAIGVALHDIFSGLRR
jgi:hypothetical protein